MSEDNKKRENVRQREIKPRAGTESSQPSAKPRQAKSGGASKPRSKQNQRRRKPSGARSASAQAGSKAEDKAPRQGQSREKNT